MPAIELGKIISAVFRLSAPLPGSFYIEIHLKVDFYQLAALESKLQIYCKMSIRIRRLFFYPYHPDKADKANNLDNLALADQAGPAGQP